MSQTQTPDEESIADAKDELRETIREALSPHMKSRQALDAKGIPPDDRGPNQQARHNDGAAMYRNFGLHPFIDELEDAEEADHEVANHPQALAHLVTHVSNWERHTLGQDDPDLSDAHRLRRPVLEWLADDDDRLTRLRPGGTEILLHGEQGTTKTTAMYWLIVLIMQLRQRENVLWLSSLDDTEWTALAPYATVCLPDDETVRVEANPYTRKLRGEVVDLSMHDIARDVLRYENPRDLLRQLDTRTAGQFYVVYPDPEFRKCQEITSRSYASVREVEALEDATSIHHWWFALVDEIAHGRYYREWTTIVGDEAHKWLKKGKSNDEHDWWDKIDDFAATWGDARKKRLSAILATHEWPEIPDKVRRKMRWGATMNGEPFPSKAPLDGRNRNQDLGDTCIWTPLAWNFVGYPNLPRKAGTTVPAEIKVSYPDWEAAKNART
jgi:hypothetical protein